MPTPLRTVASVSHLAKVAAATQKNKTATTATQNANCHPPQWTLSLPSGTLHCRHYA